MCASIQAAHEYMLQICVVHEYHVVLVSIRHCIQLNQTHNYTNQFQKLQDERVWEATQEKQVPFSTIAKTRPCPQNQVSACQPVCITHNVYLIKWFKMTHV